MDNGQDIRPIMTGGESLLAWQKLYIDLFEHPRMKDLKNVTFETNTTQHLHKDFPLSLRQRKNYSLWNEKKKKKLSVRGELGTLLLNRCLMSIAPVDGSDIYPKFVVLLMMTSDEVTRAVPEYS